MSDSAISEKQMRIAAETELERVWAENERLTAEVSRLDELLNECVNEVENLARGYHITGDPIDRERYAWGLLESLQTRWNTVSGRK